jgi:hypothetical protein
MSISVKYLACIPKRGEIGVYLGTQWPGFLLYELTGDSRSLHRDMGRGRVLGYGERLSKNDRVTVGGMWSA